MTFKIIAKLGESRFLQTSLIYSLTIGSFSAIRISFIFLLSNFFEFNDIIKFTLYSAFAVSTDILSILGSYLGINFFGKRIACIFGFMILLLGYIFLFFSFKSGENILLYFALTLICIAIGILKCNLFVISNLHLREEFSENLADYGSILHNWSVLASFIMICLTGLLIKNYSIFIPIYSLCLSIGTFVFFIISQKQFILSAFREKSFHFLKILKLLLIIIFIAKIFFCFFYFSLNNFAKYIPIIIFSTFLCYMIFQIKKHKDYREIIIAVIIFSFFMIFYIGLERQRDTSMAFFIARNLDLSIFSLKLTAIQLNSLFSFFILLIGFLLFKYKIHGKFKTRYTLFIISFFVSISFALLAFQTKIYIYFNGSKIQDGMHLLNPFIYIISMFFMAISNVFIYSKFIEICKVTNKSLNLIISSYMIISIATGFYLAKFYNKFMIVENVLLKTSDIKSGSIYSLIIYSDGFTKLSIISFSFFIFCLIFFNLKYIKRIIN